MWIQREIEQKITTISQKKACLVLTGARQTGKSSLLRHIFPGANNISLDLPRHAQMAEENGEKFLEDLSTPAIIDEVQYAPALFRYLKSKIDERPEATGQYLLSGSQKFQLMEGVSESLSGRANIIEIHSLSHREIENHSGRPSEGNILWERIFKGGYPEIYEKDLEPEEFFSNYVATYIERDVRKLLNIRNLRSFDRFMRLLSTSVGQLLSYNRLASDLGISASTVKEWIDVLQVSNVIAILEPWFSNTRKRLIKTPKVYFCDTGLACSLAGMQTVNDLMKSPLLGQIFENHVFAQLLRASWNQGIRPQLYFFRDHKGNEIDFLEHRAGNFRAYECKASEDPKIELKGLKAMQESFPKAEIELSFVCSSRESGRRKQGFLLENSIDFKA